MIRAPQVGAYLGLCENELGLHRDAAEHFTTALELLPAEKAEFRDALLKGLAAAKQHVGTLGSKSSHPPPGSSSTTTRSRPPAPRTPHS